MGSLKNQLIFRNILVSCFPWKERVTPVASKKMYGLLLKFDTATKLIMTIHSIPKRHFAIHIQNAQKEQIL